MQIDKAWAKTQFLWHHPVSHPHSNLPNFIFELFDFDLQFWPGVVLDFWRKF